MGGLGILTLELFAACGWCRGTRGRNKVLVYGGL